jgi:hypothetical protein
MERNWTQVNVTWTLAHIGFDGSGYGWAGYIDDLKIKNVAIDSAGAVSWYNGTDAPAAGTTKKKVRRGGFVGIIE